jgi:hypothetical protein
MYSKQSDAASRARRCGTKSLAERLMKLFTKAAFPRITVQRINISKIRTHPFSLA